jgi:hypothetical protein
MNLKKKIKKIYPVVLFVYNRPIHTKKVILTLKKNYLASNTSLYIFSDGPKNKTDKKKVTEVRKIINSIDGFKKTKVFKKQKNIGLKKSIKLGITKIIKKYGAVIVLEDDIITSPSFLYFMNYSLNFFKNHSKIWHINGWNLNLKNKKFNKTFFYRTMHCWGWATWANKWKNFNDNINEIEKKIDKKTIYRLNNDGSENFYWQFLANKKNLINTWAIFWYLTIFLNKGLCLSPLSSFTKNIGLDGSGEHSVKDLFSDNHAELNNSFSYDYPKKEVENRLIFKKIYNYYKIKNSLKNKILNKIYLNFKVLS